MDRKTDVAQWLQVEDREPLAPFAQELSALSRCGSQTANRKSPRATMTACTSCTPPVRPGLPKGVVHTHNTAMWGVLTIAGTTHYREHERYLACLPMFHVGALTPLTVNVYRGAASIVMRTFDPVRAWELIEAEKITCGLAVPAMLNFMLQVGDVTRFDYSTLRWCMCGAAPVPEALIEAYAKLGIEVHQIYGLTENMWAGVPDRSGARAEKNRLDGQGVFPHRHTGGQRGRRRLRGRLKPEKCGCVVRT